MNPIIQIYAKNNITSEILGQVEEIGRLEEMLPIYYDANSLFTELNVNNSYLLVVTSEDMKSEDITSEDITSEDITSEDTNKSEDNKSEDTNTSDKVLSFLVFTINESIPKSVHIKSICIDSSYKRFKLGTSMIDALKQIYGSITLYVQCANSVACNFYKKQKFKIIKKMPDYYETLDDTEAYYMVFIC